MIIPAGGSGRRFGGVRPKQFVSLAGRPVLAHTVLAFDRSPSVGRIVVVAPAAHRSAAERMLRAAGCRKLVAVVEGGKERQDSVWNGLEAFEPHPGIVLVHDAVRPIVPEETIEAVIRAARRYGAAVAALPVTDTLKREGPRGFTASTVERSGLWAVQTPQGFRTRILLRAHLAAQRDGVRGTDETSLVERLGVPVRLVPGDRRTLKITTSGDLDLCAAWLFPARRGSFGQRRGLHIPK